VICVAVGSRVGVSVLCPAYVPTGIAHSDRNRPTGTSFPKKSNARLAKEAELRKAVAAGKLSAADVARAVVAAVKENRFYVLTHPAIKGAVRADPGYELASGLELHFTRGGDTRRVYYERDAEACIAALASLRGVLE